MADSIHRIAFDPDRNLDSMRHPDGRRLYEWFLEIPGFRRAATEGLSALRCPSDTLGTQYVTYVMAAIQGADSTEHPAGITASVNLLDQALGTFAMTNYGGCGGATDWLTRPVPVKYPGVMTSSRKIKTSDVRDGLSQTLMYGEMLGGIARESRQRNSVQNWLAGGVAFGTRRYFPVSSNDQELLGGVSWASDLGFSSAHHSGVYFAFCDGHVSAVSRQTDDLMLYALCGKDDGRATPLEP